MLQYRGTIGLGILVTLMVACEPPSLEELNERYGTVVRTPTVAQFNPAWSDPCTGESGTILPQPTNLAFMGSTDGTLLLENDTPEDKSDPFNALGTLDGWSTVAPVSFTFSGPVDAATVVGAAGGASSTVRLFKVSLAAEYPFPTSVKLDPADPPVELVAGVDYEVRVTRITEAYNDSSDGCATKVREKDQVSIVPLRPLEAGTSYLVAVTGGIMDAEGYPVESDAIYRIVQGTEPLTDRHGNSRMNFIPGLRDDAMAQGLESLRSLVNTFELALGLGKGISGILLSWTFTTQGVDAGLETAADSAEAGAYLLGPAMDTSGVISQGSGDIYLGTVDLKQYLGANPTEGYWRLEDGQALTRFTRDMRPGEGPNVERTETAPVLVVLPNSQSGHTMPAAGWPVVIFQHTISQNRGNLLAFVEALTDRGVAAVAMDLPLHGLNRYEGADPAGAESALFPFSLNAPAGLYRALPWFAGLSEGAQERHTYDFGQNVLPLDSGTACAGLSENAPCALTGAESVSYPGLCRSASGASALVCSLCGAGAPDGHVDESGAYFFNPGVMLRTRDNLRQAVADFMQLRKTLGTMTFSAAWSGVGIAGTPGATLFDESRVSVMGHGLGATLAAVLMAVDPTIRSGVLVSPIGGMSRGLEASEVLGGPLSDGLACQGVVEGGALYETFFWALQTVLDAVDPLNFGGAVDQPVLMMEMAGVPGYAQESVAVFPGDRVFPGAVSGEPLSGSSPLAEVMGLETISASVPAGAGVRALVRIGPAAHTTLLDPRLRCGEVAGQLGQSEASPECLVYAAAAREEMLEQLGSFIASEGAAVNVARMREFGGYTVEVLEPVAP